MPPNLSRDSLEVIDKLKLLSREIGTKCEALASPYNATTVDKISNLCARIRKNCEKFEEELFHEKSHSIVSSNINSELVITLNLLDIIGEENCRKLKHDQIGNFKTDLKVFTRSYLLQTQDPVFFDLHRLFMSNSTNENEDSTRNQEILGSGCDELKQTSTELNPQPSTSVKNNLLKSADRPPETDQPKDADLLKQVNTQQNPQPASSSSIEVRVEEISESKEGENSTGSSNQGNTQQNPQPGSSSSTEVRVDGQISLISSHDRERSEETARSIEGEISSGSSNQANTEQNPEAQARPEQILEATNDVNVAGSSNHANNQQNPISQIRPEEIVVTKDVSVAEYIKEESETTDIEDQSVAEQNSRGKIDALTSDIEISSADQDNLGEQTKTDSLQSVLDDHIYFKKVSVDPDTLEDETGKCDAVGVEVLEPIEECVDKEEKVSLVDQENAGNSKEEKIINGADIVNSSKEEQILEDPHNKLVSISLDHPTSVNYKHEIDDDSLSESVEKALAVSTDCSIENKGSESMDKNLEVTSEHKNSTEESSPVMVNTSQSALDTEASPDKNAKQTQELLPELQNSAVSTVRTATDIFEYSDISEDAKDDTDIFENSGISEDTKDEKEKDNAEVEPCMESAIAETISRNSEEIGNESTKDIQSGQIDENTDDKQLFLTNLGLSSTANYETVRTIRDELMEIFAEVNCREGRNGVMEEVDRDLDTSTESSLDEAKYSESKVALALKELEEDSSSDESMMSHSDLDLSCIDDDSLLNECSYSEEVDNGVIKDETKKSVNNFTPRKCSVILERRDLVMLQQKLQNTQESSTSIALSTEDETDHSVARECSVQKECSEIDKGNKSTDEDAEIDRLCQLSTLDRKRRREEKRNKRKMKRKRHVSLSGSETTDLSGYSSVCDEEINKQMISGDEKEEDDHTPLDPNTLLAEIVCHTIHDSDSDSSAISSNEEDKHRCKTKKNDINTDSKNEEDILREGKKSTWKDDPLLRGNLNIASEKERNAEYVSRKRRRSSQDDCNKIKIPTKKMHRYLYPDDSESVDSTDSADEFEDDFRDTKKIKNYDSDIEIVDPTSGNVINVDSEEETEDKRLSRKNIKSVLSSKSLTESTQRAAEEEDARIRKLDEQKLMRCSQESENPEDELVLDASSDGSKIIIDHNLSRKLFPHQVEGVKFMWESCYLSMDDLNTFQGTGCILAHNMGLGKTLQVVTLVHTLFNHPVTNTKHVLVVCPISTIAGWRREFVNALKIVDKSKDIKISCIETSNGPVAKCFAIARWRRDGGVLIMGYEAFSRLTRDDIHQSEEVRQALVDPGPDLVVCDEGHILKNGKSMRTQALMKMKTKRRIALTGTPLQNNLKEYYFMVQFVKPNLLGNNREFNRQFVNPIMNGQYEDSRDYDITLMKKRTHVLHRLLKNTVQRFEATELKKYLQNMQDYAIFIQLHPLQEKLYKTYLEIVKGKLGKKTIKSFFVDYQILKYICSHPQLLHTMEAQNVQRNKNTIKETEVISQEPEVNQAEEVPQDWWKSYCSEDIKTSIEFGTKLQVMMAIIEEAEKIGEKVLIFTSSLVELSSVEYFLKLNGTSKCPSWKSKRDYFRMDGTVPPSIRTNMCDMFNNDSNKTLRVFLMSHKVGGLGLNLTGANRVILLGANFNPSLDSQSIYRAYRFGQTKMVYIYRLLSMGTMEEKIYHRCVTKLAIASRVVDKHQIRRHYKNLDLEDLYNVEIDLSLQRPPPAKPDDDLLSAILLKFECIYKFHYHQKLLENRPDEDLNEEDQRVAWEEFNEMIEKEKNAPQNPAAPKLPILVQNQGNHVNRLPTAPIAPSFPVWNGLENELRRRSNITQAQSSTTGQTIDWTMSQAMSSSISPNNSQNDPGTLWRINVENAGAHHSNAVEGRTIDGVGSQSTNRTTTRPTGGGTISEEGRNALLNATAKILQSNALLEKYKMSKQKSSSIGPNPLYLAKLKHRKENLSMNSTGTPWRTSSSDDFQSPSHSKGNVARKTQSKAVGVPTPADDDVILIDISEDRPEAVQKQLDELRQRNLTITSKTVQRKENDNPPVIDIT